jgi:hypothetical protein
MAVVDDISWAIEQFRYDNERQKAYKLAHAYYDGQHRLQFAINRFRTIFGALFGPFADNLCPAVIDSLTDRLDLIGFTSSDVQQDPQQQPPEPPAPEPGGVLLDPVTGKPAAPAPAPLPVPKTIDPLAQAAWRLWERNRMELQAAEVHREALKAGDGYVIVWPDAQLRPAIWPQLAHEMAVDYDENLAGRIRKAAKLWSQNDGRLRLNLFYPDRIEKFITRDPVHGGLNSQLEAEKFERVPGASSGTRTGEGEPFELDDGVLRNPYGRVPVFHFANKRLYREGQSELSDVIPLQDGLNKSVVDMFVAMEFSSFRQRWVTGIEVETDETTGRPTTPPWNYGVDRMLAATDKDVKFGDFSATDLNQFLKVQEAFRSEIARVSGTPLHYLFINEAGNWPSGEALKSAEARFTRKIEDRQSYFGCVWQEVLAFAMQIDGEQLPDDFELNAIWDSASPRSEREIAETMLMKKAIGVSPAQLMKELGYDDDLIAQMQREAGASQTVAGGAQESLSISTATGRESIKLPGMGLSTGSSQQV